jgi:hypothetical protein
VLVPEEAADLAEVVGKRNGPFQAATCGFHAHVAAGQVAADEVLDHVARKRTGVDAVGVGEEGLEVLPHDPVQ